MIALRNSKPKHPADAWDPGAAGPLQDVTGDTPTNYPRAQMKQSSCHHFNFHKNPRQLSVVKKKKTNGIPVRAEQLGPNTAEVTMWPGETPAQAAVM